MESYENLLQKAYQQLPKREEGASRFKIPKVVSQIQGNKTLVKNFSELASAVRRDEKHLAKFFLKEFAAPGSVQQGVLIIMAKIPAENLQKKFENYIKEFVYCKICKEPDTKIEKAGRISFLKCDACGATSPVRNI
jgi:translation initiation factor 2 subunit 2